MRSILGTAFIVIMGAAFVACDDASAAHNPSDAGSADVASHDSGADTGGELDVSATDAQEDGAADAGQTDTDAGNPEHPFAGHPLLDDAPHLIAHRGGAREFPEHTVLAYEGALALGADVLELDVHLTADGRMVCLHDATVDRTTDGEGAVRNLTFDQIRALDAAFDFAGPDGDYPWRGQGVQIPTFEEVLDGFPDVLYVIEAKPADLDLVQLMIDAVVAREMEDQVAFGAFWDPATELAREHGLLTGMTAAEQAVLATFPEAVRDGYVAPVPLAQMPARSVTVEVAERAATYGVTLQPWTVNDRAEMDRLLDLGVLSIMTDRPSLLLEAMAERGLVP